MKDITKEQLEKEMRELKEKIQLDFILDLKDRVENYAQKTIKTRRNERTKRKNAT